MRALVTGATGFIGQHLLAKLERPVVLSRNAEAAQRRLAKFNVQAFAWDPMATSPPVEAFEGIDVVFHLAGDSVATGRWTEAKKKQIRESREVGTRHLVQGLRQLQARPKVLVSASATGWYGDRGDEVLVESSPPAQDFLGEVCVAWEREAQIAKDLGMRVACLRTGIVFGSDGGALEKLLMPFKLGVGGTLGNGHQWMPWIHVDDLVAMYLYAAENSNIAGPMNGVAPNPVTNKEFTKALGAALHRPTILPVPYFALRVALGEFAKMLFESQRVLPQVAQTAGFVFRYPEIGPALRAIVAG